MQLSSGWNLCLNRAAFFTGSSKGESISLFIQFVGRIQFHAIIGLSSSFPCWLSYEGRSQLWKTSHIPWLVVPFLHLPFFFKVSCNYIGPTKIIQNYLPISRSLKALKSLLPIMVTYLQVLGIKAWTFFFRRQGCSACLP